MNFGISGEGIGLIGGLVLFGAVMIAFTVVAAAIVRLVRGRDDTPATPGERAPEDDYIL